MPKRKSERRRLRSYYRFCVVDNETGVWVDTVRTVSIDDAKERLHGALHLLNKQRPGKRYRLLYLKPDNDGKTISLKQAQRTVKFVDDFCTEHGHELKTKLWG